MRFRSLKFWQRIICKQYGTRNPEILIPTVISGFCFYLSKQECESLGTNTYYKRGI